MRGPFLVGVDCGTQSAKVVIYDAHGRIAAQGRQVLRAPSRPTHGIVVHPDDDIWTSIGLASKAAIADFVSLGGVVEEIVAVGICPIRCCKAFLAADGSLIEPVMSWMDDRAYSPYVPTNPALAYATTLSGYVSHRFTGAFKDTAANNIAMQWPIDPDTWEWTSNTDLLATFGLRRDQLFDLQMPGEIVGSLTSHASLATGLPAGIPVVATANDKAVEMLGAGPLSSSTALVSLGTYIAAMVPGTVHHPAPANFWTNFACIPNQYLYESTGVRRGMWTLTWFLDLLGPELRDRALAEGLSREELLEREAAQAVPGSDGLMTVLDWLAPSDKPFRKGTMIGFDARHTRGHIYRSILEAIALSMKSNVEAMCTELSISLNEIVLSGGGSTSPLFLQIFADVFGIRATRSEHGGASLGAAMCAASAVGLYPGIEKASIAMAAPRESFEPNPSSTDVYRQMLDLVYPTIRNATDPLFEVAYPIFHPIFHTDQRN